MTQNRFLKAQTPVALPGVPEATKEGSLKPHGVFEIEINCP